MHVYSFPTFNLTKVLLTAEELALDYQFTLLDFTKGEHKSPEHLARHPLGKVPAVELDGQNYFESNAICRLLAERNDNALYGDTPEERAIVNEWADMATLHAGRWLTVMFFENKIKQVFFGGETDQTAVDEALSFLSQQLPPIEAQLSQHAFLAGDKLTIADIIAYSYFSTTPHSGVDLNPYPKISAWIETIEARPSFQKAMNNLPGNSMFAMLNA